MFVQGFTALAYSTRIGCILPGTYVRPEYSHPSLLAQTSQLIVNAYARPDRQSSKGF